MGQQNARRKQLPPASDGASLPPPAARRQATCNDGTSAYYYFRKGWGNQWLIYLEVRALPSDFQRPPFGASLFPDPRAPPGP